jgi:iron(III) transport system substrate-binding protein
VQRERTAGQYLWDIILASTGPVVFNLIPTNALAPLRDALIKPDIADDKTWIGGFEAGFIDKEKKYYFNPMGSANLPLGFVNRDCLSREVFSMVDDLKKPQLRGKIVWFDPTGGSGGVVGPTTWVIALDKGEDWLKDLFQNYGVTYARDYRQMTDWMMNCSRPVAWGMDDDVVEQMQKAGIGKNVEKILGKEFTGTINPGGPGGNESIGWYNNAPHPNAAKIFVNWYLSKEFQDFYAATVKDNSRRADSIPGEPDQAMTPGVQYLNWIDEDATVKIRDMQARIKEWGIVK